MFRRFSRDGRRFVAIFVVAATVGTLFIGHSGFAATPDLPVPPGREGLVALPGDLPSEQPTNPDFREDVKLDQERFYLFVPPNYRGNERFGLVAFVNAGDQMNLPAEWRRTLADRKLLYIAPQGVGNRHPVSRRVSIALVAIRKMIELYDVDPARIFVAGHSGGAKVACALATTEPDLVRGVVANCAVVPPSDVIDDEDSLKKVKSQVGFAIVTGPKDFNHESIVAIHDQLTADGYRVKLFDVAGMAHQLPRAGTLAAALDWLDGREKPAEKKPTPKKAKQPPPAKDRSG
jgi:predicted esterase